MGLPPEGGSNTARLWPVAISAPLLAAVARSQGVMAAGSQPEEAVAPLAAGTQTGEAAGPWVDADTRLGVGVGADTGLRAGAGSQTEAAGAGVEGDVPHNRLGPRRSRKPATAGRRPMKKKLLQKSIADLQG
jgi:hypothetical protein